MKGKAKMKLLVVDGNSILNRAFYGIKLLSTKEGVYTNGIYGFLTMLKKICDESSPDAVAIAFDLRGPTFRHEKYADYKGTRKGMPPELASQLPVLKELLADLGYRIITSEGYEADDILGTFSRLCCESGDECIIATGDRDSLQLVSPCTTVRLASTKFGQPQVTIYDEAKVKEDYGVTPPQLIDIKAIQGDSSDNIPGVAGIGQKGAGELIQKFGSLDYIYENIDTLDIKDGMRNKLIASKDSALMSYFLGTINKEVPIDGEIKDYVKTDGDLQKAVSLMTKLELFNLMEKLEIKNDGVLTSQDEGEKEEMKLVVLDNPSSVLTITEDEGKAYFSAVYTENGEIDKLYFAVEDICYEVPASESFLRAFFKNKTIKKYTHDIKLLHKAALRLGVKVEGVAMDTLLAGYLLNPSASGYDVLRLAAEYRVFAPENENDAAKSAMVMPALCNALTLEIDKNEQRELLENIEIPLAFVLAQMEVIGFCVDREGIKKYGDELEEKINKIRASIIEQVGYEFNISSPKQLGEALFVKLGLPHGKKTKSGYSTNVDVLEKLRDINPVVNEILEYRTLTKLKSTYCDGLLKVIGEDGRIHSSFNQTETRTGRISSTEPNMQNIPVRTPIGRELRKFFIAENFENENGILVDADYSQIELRVLAHVANDSAMTEDFRENRDIHASTAARVFRMPLEFVTADMRRKAKAVNFGIVYGIGAFSLSNDIGVSIKEADEYIKEYLHNYLGVAAYMDKVCEDAREKGYVQTIFGRRRYLPELKSSNFNMRSFGERVAKNMPIQGAAADIIKIAMIKVSDRLEKEKLEAKLILQVHDELIVECPESEEEFVKELLTEEMENAVHLSVSMKAQAISGKTWYDAKG